MGRSGLRAVVIGAGLAGLACATDLVAAGATVRVLEAGDAVGGRMRTDRQAGFLLDRGFQVFNTSYPQVRRRIDLRALQLRPFTPGMLLHTSRGRVRFTDPTRQPRRAADALTGHLAGPRDMAALALLTSRDMLGPASRIRHRRDQSTLTALRRAGISGELIERLFQPAGCPPLAAPARPATRSVTTLYHHPLAAGRADPAGGLRTGDPAHQRAERGHARIREQRPRADLHLGARDRQREPGTGCPRTSGHLVQCRHRGLGAPGDLHHRGRVAGHGRAASAYPRLPRRPGPLRLR